MSPRILIRPDASADLDTHAEYLSERRRGMGTRFHITASQAFQRLARMPGLGQPYEVASPQFAGLRCWAVPRFKNHLIFHRPIEGGIEMIRVLHGARDIDAILDSEEDSPDDGADASDLP